jgi:hypothetical protein
MHTLVYIAYRVFRNPTGPRVKLPGFFEIIKGELQGPLMELLSPFVRFGITFGMYPPENEVRSPYEFLKARDVAEHPLRIYDILNELQQSPVEAIPLVLVIMCPHEFA